MQSKTIMRYQLTSVRMAITNQTRDSRNNKQISEAWEVQGQGVSRFGVWTDFETL